MRVNINSVNHQVEIDCDSQDLTYVIEKAQKLYEATHPGDGSAGPAVGFVLERAGEDT